MYINCNQTKSIFELDILTTKYKMVTFAKGLRKKLRKLPYNSRFIKYSFEITTIFKKPIMFTLL